MAVTFDGPNTTITLESGVTEVAWIDVYSDWKRWVNDGGGDPYAAAFRVVGGDPLSAVIDAGAYFFLRNDLGWRIKPPEEDITIFVTGNLALQDLNKPSVLPTTGAFTAAILGLQPVTQGVIPSMRSNLEFVTYQNQVCIDMANTTGLAQTGTGYDIDGHRIGTRSAPCNNPDDALTIAQREGIRQFQIVSDFDGLAYNTDFSNGFSFVGDSPFVDFGMTDTLSLNNCDFRNLTINGEADGVNLFRECALENVSAFNGIAFNCSLNGSIGINGNSSFLDCFSDREGLLYSAITGIAASNLIIRNLRGSVGLEDITGGTHSIGIGGGGRIVIESTCTGGTVYARGEPYEITDNSLGTTVIDQTDSEKVSNLTSGAGASADDVLVQSIIANKITGN